MKLQNGRIAIVFLTEGEYIFTVCVSGLVSLIYKNIICFTSNYM